MVNDNILNLYKRPGETPLERINRFRFENPEYANRTLSYAGRLDPLAEGVLLILSDEANKNREEYLKLKKEYIFDVLLGFVTDTFDVMGKVSAITTQFFELRPKVESFITSIEKSFLQEYPFFSSKPVKGKPLFEWAKNGMQNEIDLPVRQVEIYSFELLDEFSISVSDLELNILDSIAQVRGNFRQADIVGLWHQVFERTPKGVSFPVFRFKIECSSGTYVRSLAQKLGIFCGTGGVALRIVRTKVGDYSIEDSLL